MHPRRRSPRRLTEVLRRIEDTAVLEPVAPRETAFAGGEYTIGVAADLATRRAAYRLVYQLYLEKEYAQPHPARMWLSIYDALPETSTLVVKRRGEVVAALTVICDSPMGLPADRIYGQELDAMRRAGRRPAEIVSLGVSPRAGRGSEILVKLFDFVYILARQIRGATDFINTVNPRHSKFYMRSLRFRVAGPEREYDKVGGAPAVLLRLDLDVADALHRQAHRPGAARQEKSRTLYKMFHGPEETQRMTGTLRRSLRPMSEREIRYFFMQKTRLLAKAPAAQRYHVEDCYPFYHLVDETAETREYLAV